MRAFCSSSALAAEVRDDDDDVEEGDSDDEGLMGSTHFHNPLSLRTNSILNFHVGKLVVVSRGTVYKSLAAAMAGVDMVNREGDGESERR